MLRASMLAILVVHALLTSPSAARAPVEDDWRSSHIEALPREVFREVRKWAGACGVLKARSSFVQTVEIKGHRYLALHFEQLRCSDPSALCSASGCLHEVYELRQGRFRKIHSLRTSEVRISTLGAQVVVEADCELSVFKCFGTIRAVLERRFWLVGVGV